MVVSCRSFAFSDYQKLLSFYVKVDDDYYPRLSQREGGLEGHMQNILQAGGSFALFEVDGEIKGAAGYAPLDEHKYVVQFTFFTFDAQFRNTLAPFRLAKFLVDNKDSLGYANTTTIIARTWYGESADRMTRMGFQQVAAVEDDLIPGRTSYYFEGNVSFIVNNIKKRKTVK